MNLTHESYRSQSERLPREGRHILAQYDVDSIVVYQAFHRDIAEQAVKHGRFVAPFSFQRMSWIKPNFLWMMYRSGWATKPNQEAVLAVRLRRAAFDEILQLAVHSSFIPEAYDSEASWRSAVATSSVRLQWDPDHAPNGDPLDRRAIQLGMRGETLRKYAMDWIVAIEDITDFVRDQAAFVSNRDALQTPKENVYPVADAEVARKLGLDAWPM